MLDFIKANVSKQYDQNEAAAEKLRGLLKNYEAKVKDLEKALKEAGDLLKKANTQNGLSAQALEDLKVVQVIWLITCKKHEGLLICSALIA